MEQLPQLRMRRPIDGPAPPMPQLVAGCRLRLATDADAEGLAQVLSDSFQEPWDVARVRQVLLDDPNVPKTFVIEREGRIVATASYQVHPEEFPDSGWVHYVGADPGSAGLGFGFAVTLAVVQESVAQGKKDVGLTTDDPRLPAIRTYRKLGFVPDMWHESHPARWEAVERALAAGRSS